MKLPIKLDDLLRQRTVESERIEYKVGWNPNAILRTVCAFANDFANLGGGYVVIGQECDANGQPVFPGLAANQLDKIQRELLAHCQLIQPPYFPTLSVEEVQGRKLMVLWVPGGMNRPYKAPASVTAEHKSWHFYIRRYSSAVEAKGEDEQEMLGLTANVPWDDRLAQQARVDDLSRALMLDYLREVGSALADEAAGLSLEALGRQMNVVGGSSEAPWPKNVGLLFFNEAPDRFFPYTQIDVVWFPEGAGGDRFEEKVFKGPLARMTREALGYIQRNYLRETVLKHPDRAEATRVWNFPYAAIEEALVNAVYHRSYEEREPIEVRISREELVILSFPGPDRSIRLEDFAAGRAVSRRYRNRRIGEFLKELDLTEGRSTGVPKILKAMATNGSPAPIFETDDDRTAYLIRLPAHPLAAAPEAASAQVTDQVTPEVTPEVSRVLASMQGEMSRQALQDALTFARVGAVTRMRVEDVFTQRRRLWVRLHGRGGKLHDMTCHHSLEDWLHDYIQDAGLDSAAGFLFRSARGPQAALSERPMSQADVYRMIGRRAEAAGILARIGCHSFRATGITEYLRNGGKLEIAQQMANHESARTTGYDRRGDQIKLDEVERIAI